MLNKLTLDTGAKRNITGHFISGAIASSIVSGTMNYRKFQNSEISKKEMINDTLKMTLQGAMTTATAVAATNYIGEGKLMQAMTVVSVGAMGVYGTQKIYERLEIQANTNKEIEDAE